MKKKNRVERYAKLITRVEHTIDERLHRWADLLQLQSDKLSWRQKYILFMIFCIGVSVICATINFNAIQ
jgi:hypothetical protein